MATQTLPLEVPEELVRMIGSPEEAAARAKELLVIELLRATKISEGNAAELLGIKRWEMIDLAAPYKISSGPESYEELLQDVENARRASELNARARSQ